MAAGGTRSLMCGALWHTVVAPHNALTEAWLRIAARGGIAATRAPHVKQLLQWLPAVGLPALPTRPPPAPSAGGHMPARTSPAAPSLGHLLTHPPPSLAFALSPPALRCGLRWHLRGSGDDPVG